MERFVFRIKGTLLAIAFTAWCATASAETPEEWVALGARVHGAFGSFIPLGIKIGLNVLRHGAFDAAIRFERSDGRRLGFAICVEGKAPTL
jgi:hypothetical protein